MKNINLKSTLKTGLHAALIFAGMTILPASNAIADVNRDDVYDIINQSGHGGGAEIHSQKIIAKEDIVLNTTLIKHYLPMVFNELEYDLLTVREASKAGQLKRDRKAFLLFGKNKAMSASSPSNASKNIFTEISNFKGFDVEGRCINDFGEEKASTYKSKRDPTLICINLPLLIESNVLSQNTFGILLNLAAHEMVHRLIPGNESDSIADDVDYIIQKVTSQENLIATFQSTLMATLEVEKNFNLALQLLKSGESSNACRYLYNARNSAESISDSYDRMHTNSVSPLSASDKRNHELFYAKIEVMLIGFCLDDNFPTELNYVEADRIKTDSLKQFSVCFSGGSEFSTTSYLMISYFFKNGTTCSDFKEFVNSQNDSSAASEVDSGDISSANELSNEEPTLVIQKLSKPALEAELKKSLHMIQYYKSTLGKIYGNEIVLNRTGLLHDVVFKNLTNYSYSDAFINATCDMKLTTKLQERVGDFNFNYKAKVVDIKKSNVVILSTEDLTKFNDELCDQAVNYYRQKSLENMPELEFSSFDDLDPIQ